MLWPVNAIDRDLAGAASWHSALSWDSPRRLLHMDQDGISAEVIFPNTAPGRPGCPRYPRKA